MSVWKNDMQSNTTVSHEAYLMTIYNEQLHVSACAGHLQVVLGELKILLDGFGGLVVSMLASCT